MGFVIWSAFFRRIAVAMCCKICCNGLFTAVTVSSKNCTFLLLVYVFLHIRLYIAVQIDKLSCVHASSLLMPAISCYSCISLAMPFGHHFFHTWCPITSRVATRAIPLSVCCIEHKRIFAQNQTKSLSRIASFQNAMTARLTGQCGLVRKEKKEFCC